MKYINHVKALKWQYCIVFFLVSTYNVIAQASLQFEIERLPATINSEYEENKPFTSLHGDSIFFTRSYHPDNIGGKDAKEDIWYSILSQEEGWLESSNKLFNINNEDANIFAGSNRQRNRIYLFEYTAVNSKRSLTLSSRSLVNGKKVNQVGHFANSILVGDEFHDAFLHYSEKTLIISMHSINSMGLEDLYVSVKDANGSWSMPQHLGPIINTRGFEISPFLSSDQKTLYFSSNGHNGLGDSDIYFSNRLDESWNNWSDPTNMGEPFNSPKFDAYLFKHNEREYYLSSNRHTHFTDLFKITLKYDQRAVQNQSDGPGSIESENKSVRTNDTLYSIVDKIRPNLLVLYFDFDIYRLNEDQKMKLAEFINQYTSDQSNYNFVIEGYTDNSGSDQYNKRLSINRAKDVSKFVRKIGIKKNQVSVVGKGVYPSIDSVTQLQMRRVEIKATFSNNSL